MYEQNGSANFVSMTTECCFSKLVTSNSNHITLQKKYFLFVQQQLWSQSQQFPLSYYSLWAQFSRNPQCKGRKRYMQISSVLPVKEPFSLSLLAHDGTRKKVYALTDDCVRVVRTGEKKWLGSNETIIQVQGEQPKTFWSGYDETILLCQWILHK